jgi:hypothetical protein
MLSLTLFFLALHTAKAFSNRVFNILTIITIGAIFLYSMFLADSSYLAWLLPLPNLIIVGNWIPLITAFLAGLGWQKIPGMRKLFFLLPLLLVCLYCAYGFFLEATPEYSDNWKDGVCLQSSEASCGPACAATLLKFYHIESKEEEMANLCLTRNSGTRLYGLYRGLKIKTAKTQWDAEIFTWTLDELRANGDFPVILLVRLDKNGKVDPRYQNEWGWIPGVTHIVLFYGFKENDKVDMADPAVGREYWHVNDLRVLWHGQGIGLIAR